MEIGAVSVMMYCFREREQLLNLNEMLAGFRMFPSYIRIGGLREDLPRGFHEAVKAFLDKFPGKLDEYEKLLTKNQVWLKRTKGVGVLSTRRHDGDGPGRPDGARGRHSATTCARRSRTSSTRRSTSTCRPRTDGDVYARYLRARWRRCAQSVKICQQALERITPTRRVRLRRLPHRAAAEGSGLHGDGSADSALPDLLAGLQRAEGRVLRAGRRPARRARVLHRVGRHQPAGARQVRARRRSMRARRCRR